MKNWDANAIIIRAFYVIVKSFQALALAQGPLHLAHGHTGAVAAGEVRDAREVVNAVRQRELLLHVGQLADPRIDSPLGAPSRPVVIRILVARKKFSSFSLQLKPLLYRY